MFNLKRFAAITCGLAALLTSPSESSACCFWNWCRPRTTYMPAAPACGPCAQQVNYVPQTCYRTVYTAVPVTTMRPVTSTDPCTGCPVTCMRPTTCYVQRPQLVPYTTYRPVYTTVASPCPTGGCGAAAPASTYYQSAPASPSAGCCGAGSPPLTYTTPPTLTSPPTLSSPPLTTPPSSTLGPPSYTIPPTTQPSLPPSSNPPTTFQQQGSTTLEPSNSYRPIPDSGYESGSGSTRSSSSAAPKLLDPSHRTTAKPLPRTWQFSQAVLSTEKTEAAAPVDDSGWHAAE